MSVAAIFKTMEYGPAPESPDAANKWLDDHHRRFDLFIDNHWVAPSTGKYRDSINPATGETCSGSASL